MIKNLTDDMARWARESATTNDKLPAYAWPGGYAISYFDDDGNTLCAECANKNDEYTEPIAGYVVEEGPENDVTCDNCAKVIAEGYDQ